jgi:hypothetical protein
MVSKNEGESSAWPPRSSLLRHRDDDSGSQKNIPLAHSRGYKFKGVKVTFDPIKRESALAERGLDFADAAEVFAGRTYTRADIRRDYGEPRFQTAGFLADRMVMVVWTPRGDVRHVISMRKCNAREQKAYRQQLDEG